jgi:hypothetical protein
VAGDPASLAPRERLKFASHSLPYELLPAAARSSVFAAIDAGFALTQVLSSVFNAALESEYLRHISLGFERLMATFACAIAPPAQCSVG